MITTGNLGMDAEIRYRQERVRADFGGWGLRKRRARRDTPTRVAPIPLSTERPAIASAIPEQRLPEPSSSGLNERANNDRSRIPAA